MDDIRIGIAGLGHRARGSWIPQLLRIPGYRITALYDFIEPLHEQALAVIPYRDQVKTFTDYETFLGFGSMDAVALCVRCLEQGAMAARALEAQKHVNAEVPAAHRLEDCWRIVLAAERSGKIYHLAEQTRYWGFVEAWRRLVHEGRLGKVTYGEGQYIGYYGTKQFFQDFETGRQYGVEDLKDHPEAKPTALNRMQPIEYLPHELSPMLKILDDRVVQVVAMGTRSPSYSHPEIAQSDIQVALMKTAKDTVLRMAVGFTQPEPQGDHHWYQLLGTRGRVEWRRRPDEKPKLWLADAQMHQFSDVDWRFQRTDAPPEARQSGHGDADYYVHAAFRDAIVLGKKPELDLYGAIDTAAPAILAAESIRQGSAPQAVPDFRPGEHRAPGAKPAERAS